VLVRENPKYPIGPFWLLSHIRLIHLALVDTFSIPHRHRPISSRYINFIRFSAFKTAVPSSFLISH
jgi:hypothetical protein